MIEEILVDKNAKPNAIEFPIVDVDDITFSLI